MTQATAPKRSGCTASAKWATGSSPFASHTEIRSSESSGLDIGGKENKPMKNKIRYTDEPMGKLQVVRDFLPSPEELAFKEEKVKVTISLSKASLDFFKNEADRHHTAYQKMIRNLLDAYAVQHKG
jgi:predicted DNA binding CopG/RHH family protein